jgi:hypothetical protein
MDYAFSRRQRYAILRYTRGAVSQVFSVGPPERIVAVGGPLRIVVYAGSTLSPAEAYTFIRINGSVTSSICTWCAQSPCRHWWATLGQCESRA